MFHSLHYENPVHFNSIHAIRIQSRANSLQKCHCRTDPKSSFAEYLQSSLGFSSERASKITTLFKGYNPKNPHAVLTFFKSHGFSETHIKSIIDKAPLLLGYADPVSSLSPKIQFLKDKGSSESDIADLMVSVPFLFTRSIEGYIKPLLDLLSSMLGTHESAVQLLIQRRYLLNVDRCSSNMAILRNCGAQDQHILRLLRQAPRALSAKSDLFNDSVEMIKEMGFKPDSWLFIEAICVMVSLSGKTWDAKFKIYTSLGWSAEEALSLFRKQPIIMRLSEEKIRKGVNYLTKELGWSPSYILTYPTMLFHSLEERIIPRHRFLQFLASRGLIKKNGNLASSFMMTDEKFFKYFVMRFESKVPYIFKIYEDLIESKQLNIKGGEDNDVQ